jgi:hypothetical protein
MRTLVDIPDKQLRELTRLGTQKKLSRAAIIREAIASYLAVQTRKKGEDAFGLWGNRKIDGLEYQEKLRSEW